MCTVTARDFRQNMKSLLDRVDIGEDVIISRGDCHYMVVPVRMKPDLTPELMARIEEARQEFQRGEYTRMSTHDEIDAYLEAL